VTCCVTEGTRSCCLCVAGRFRSVRSFEFYLSKRVRKPKNSTATLLRHISCADRCTACLSVLKINVRCSFVDSLSWRHSKVRTVEIAGVDASIGFTQWTNKPSTQDADVGLFWLRSRTLCVTSFSKLVTLVRAAGGIPFVKTNVPQVRTRFANYDTSR
jgi:hypothetical protein